MRIGKVLSGLFLSFVLSGCIAIAQPYPDSIGGTNVKMPAAEKFRGRPVVQITFIAGADTSSENVFFEDYKNSPIVSGTTPINTEIDDDNRGLTSVDENIVTDEGIARNNLKSMFAKNTFYALHLAKYLKMRSDGDLAVILNPTTLKFDPGQGYRLEPFEKAMPPYDVEVNMLSYVHPNTKPSNKSSIITTYGESLAPIISMRVDPAINPAVQGALVLTSEMLSSAHDPDGKGVRAQLIDRFNIEKYGAGKNFKKPEIDTKDVSSGPFVKGTFFEIDAGAHDLEKTPIPETLIPPKKVKEAGYVPGEYMAYEFYDAYYRIIVSALGAIDNNKSATTSQKEFWSNFEPNGMDKIMLENTNRGKKIFVIKAKQAEIRYLEDRDQRWSEAVLDTNDFLANFNNLRTAEQTARNQYIEAQVQAVVGALLAVGGAYASARSNSNNNTAGTVGGVALIGIGAALIARAVSDIANVDVAFKSSFESAYDSQKSYVFEISENERLEVRAKSYAEFKNFVKQRYNKRFGIEPGVPTS